MDLLDRAFGAVGDRISAAMPEGVLRSLIVDGVIAGVGGVLVFLPQILILFFFISLLEECGYMARAAYLMDRVMARIGLSGKSFIPLLSSFACAVPGIMATRAIEDRRDRLVTILIAPLMTCSARLQVYSLLIAAFIPDHRYLGGWVRLQAVTLFALYAGRHRGGDRRGAGAAADLAARPDALVCDGAARIPVAVAAKRGRARVGQRLVVPAAGRHLDHRGRGRRLGGGLFPA